MNFDVKIVTEKIPVYVYILSIFNIMTVIILMHYLYIRIPLLVYT